MNWWRHFVNDGNFYFGWSYWLCNCLLLLTRYYSNVVWSMSVKSHVSLLTINETEIQVRIPETCKPSWCMLLAWRALQFAPKKTADWLHFAVFRTTPTEQKWWYLVLIVMCNERIKVFALRFRNSVTMPHYACLNLLGHTVDKNCMNIDENMVLWHAWETSGICTSAYLIFLLCVRNIVYMQLVPF